MELYQFLFKNRMTQRSFATLLGCQKHIVSRMVRKEGSPCLYTAVSIVEITNGDVRFEDLLCDRDVNILKEKGFNILKEKGV